MTLIIRPKCTSRSEVFNRGPSNISGGSHTKKVVYISKAKELFLFWMVIGVYQKKLRAKGVHALKVENLCSRCLLAIRASKLGINLFGRLEVINVTFGVLLSLFYIWINWRHIFY